jgi:ribonuclease VapC
MIAVDSSALMAIILDEPHSADCMVALQAEADLVISAGTVAEALVVAGGRNVSAEMESLIDGLGFEIVPVTAASARRIAGIYRQWGRGAHSAGLNFDDCFSYEVAQERGCPLLYVGEDFAKTDVKSAL